MKGVFTNYGVSHWLTTEIIPDDLGLKNVRFTIARQNLCVKQSIIPTQTAGYRRQNSKKGELPEIKTACGTIFKSSTWVEVRILLNDNCLNLYDALFIPEMKGMYGSVSQATKSDGAKLSFEKKPALAPQKTGIWAQLLPKIFFFLIFLFDRKRGNEVRKKRGKRKERKKKKKKIKKKKKKKKGTKFHQQQTIFFGPFFQEFTCTNRNFPTLTGSSEFLCSHRLLIELKCP